MVQWEVSQCPYNPDVHSNIVTIENPGTERPECMIEPRNRGAVARVRTLVGLIMMTITLILNLFLA